jgi:hypothetical protein
VSSNGQLIQFGQKKQPGRAPPQKSQLSRGPYQFIISLTIFAAPTENIDYSMMI